MSWRAGIQGYAARWDVTTAALGRPQAPHLSRPAIFQKGCFLYDPDRVAIWFMHREAQPVGVGSRISLDMWEDDVGLAFTFKPPEAAFSVVAGIADGRYSHCSVGISIHASTMHGGVESISSAVVREVSICPRGACPGAICWHIGNGDAALPSEARALLPGWNRGRASRHGRLYA